MISRTEALEMEREEYREKNRRYDELQKKVARVDEIMQLMKSELWRALDKHKRVFNSRHEGYAVIKEELEELWDEIKADADWSECEKEAVQLGAMAMRFLLELKDK